MRNRETVFDYVGEIFMVFGVSIFCLNLFCMMFGESAKDISTMFAMGAKGLSLATMLQFFLTSAITVTLKFVFFTDGLIKQISIAVRTVCMFVLVLVMMVIFIFLFGWFPTDMWEPWVMFFLCFGTSIAVSTVVSGLKEKTENKKMEEALERLKQEGK